MRRDLLPDQAGPIAVAMSGGLDSAMALILLHEAGLTVAGVTMRLLPEDPSGVEQAGIASAQAVCAQVGVPHHLVDHRADFEREVLQDFVGVYARAQTPNPCLRCNDRIKFGALLASVQSLGFERLATGHYARIERRGDRFTLWRGVDSSKDQSYFLYRLGQGQLARTVFPLGHHLKAELRAMARSRGLPVSERKESQDVCFLRGQGYAGFLQQYAPEALLPGPIVDRAGVQLGEHRGLPLYTVGQRSGLGISAPQPLYVLALDRERNALVVGPVQQLDRLDVGAVDMHYVLGEVPAAPLTGFAQIRYRARAVPATLYPVDSQRARFVFQSPVRGVAPGQGIVLYNGDQVVAGGCISTESDQHKEEAA
ncbi:MAG: tRNA 2-thiouridine(34) synthase MnmA [Anaerolineae bacterium]|jgi:tRNA-specific 2-thiouridylase|nr:tRNA 2-thiouridine(34) synthase MnmA [Chloroflexota bacterium]